MFEGKENNMRKKVGKSRLIALLLVLLMAALCGCGRRESSAAPVESAPNAAPADPAISGEQTLPGRADGERFEKTIVLEGMEETVACEHVRNETLEFELDYEYEALDRYREAERERFISRYETPEDPWNYLEIRRDTGSAELVASAVAAALADDFSAVETDSVTLDGAGACLRIEASGGRENAAALQTVYVIPAPDGCLVAAAHCTFESAEGFGARFAELVNTLTVIAG